MKDVGENKGPTLMGYRVVTESLLLGDRVYKKGDFVPAGGTGKELQYALGVRLIEPVFEGDEDVTADQPSQSKRFLKGLLAFTVRKT